MKQHSFLSHTPAEMRRISNLGHIVEGALFTTVGVLSLLGNLGVFSWASLAWPILVLISGIVLLFLLYAFHPFSEWGLIWRDAQQREHTIIAAAVAIAGVAELLSSRTSALNYLWPTAIILTGGLFLFHAQHGTSEAAARVVQQHWSLGITLIVAGLLNFVEIINGERFAAILWPIVLLIAAVQLLLYREPEGAYEDEVGHGGHAGHESLFHVLIFLRSPTRAKSERGQKRHERSAVDGPLCFFIYKSMRGFAYA